MKDSKKKISTGTGLKIVIPILVVVLAAAGAYGMIKAAPKAQKREPVVPIPSVRTTTFHKQSYNVTVSIMGTVVAAREITLQPQVGGKIVQTSDAFVPGGYFNTGDKILQIDRKDYELALAEAQADVVDAEYELKVENGYQNVAKSEWELLKKTSGATDKDAELALRKPHLEKAKAALKAAQAKCEQARIDLKRTEITAPFPCMVESKSADLGATVAAQEELATLVGTDEFWIQATIPVDRLDWIHFPTSEKDLGSRAFILGSSTGKNSIREGRVIRLLPSLESEGRMARVLISVKDPLNLKGGVVSPLLLQSYVNVEIEGTSLENVYAVPRTAFRDNSRIWVLDDMGRLDIRQVSPIWKDAKNVVLNSGLNPGEKVILSTISTPVQGMQLSDMDQNETRQANQSDGTDEQG